MKYRINWTELVGYYTEMEADSAQEARDAFERAEHDSCEPCGFCETETDSIEVTLLDEQGQPTDEPETMDSLMSVVRAAGWSQVDRDLDGQIVIYTGLRQDGVNVVPLEDGVTDTD